MTSNIGSKKIIDVTKDWVNKSDNDKRLPLPLNDPETFDTATIISRLQTDPKAASILMNAATDGDMLSSLRLLKDSAPEDFDKLVRENPKMKEFLDKIWYVLNSNDNGDGLNGSSDELSSTSDEDAGNPEFYRKLFSTVKGELEATLKPEFLNRIDEVVVFSQLTPLELSSVTDRLLQRTIQRAKQERNISLQVSENSLSQILKLGSTESSLYGARPLRRAIQRIFEDPVSEAIIKGFLCEGDTALVEVTSSRNENSCTVKITRPDGALFSVNVEVDSTTFTDNHKDDDDEPVNGSIIDDPMEAANPFRNRT